MKLFFTVILMIFSAMVSATTPILQYSWHNQVSSSSLTVMDNGEIVHQERALYRMENVTEKNLSKEELKFLVNLLDKVVHAPIASETVEASMGSKSGTIEIQTKKGMQIVEGVVRDSTNIYQAKAYRSDSEDISELKDFIFKYTENDMDF